MPQQTNKGIRYRRQLRKCGFRSWVRANERRCELCGLDEAAACPMLWKEFVELQKLADLYLAWKLQAQRKQEYDHMRYICKRAGIDWKSIAR